MDGSVTGYNREQIEELTTVVEQIADNSTEDIIDRLHTNIIVPMSSAWYAPEAVEFFEGFREVVRDTGVAITNAYNQFIEALGKAGALWAENTKGDAPTMRPIHDVELDLSVSEILPDNAGNITIDEVAATAVANNLHNVQGWIMENLATRSYDLDAATAFIGHGQADAVQNCLTDLSIAISKLFQYLTDGEDSLQSQINKAVAKYQEVAQDVETGFNNANVG